MPALDNDEVPFPKFVPWPTYTWVPVAVVTGKVNVMTVLVEFAVGV